MEEKHDLNNKTNNFQNFIEFQRKIMDSIPKKDDNLNIKWPTATLYTLDELFIILNEHFNEFHQIEKFNAILHFVDRCLYEQITRNGENSTTNDVGILLLDFLEQYREDEKDLDLVVQIINQILNTLKKCEKVNISQKVFIKLSTILPTIGAESLISRIITCLQLYMEIFPGQRHDIIQNLWSELSERLHVPKTTITATDIEILINFYDEFYEINQTISDDPTVVTIIQEQLKSGRKEERKRGYYLVKKMLHYLMEKLNKLSALLTTHNSIYCERLWAAYLEILENLEEDKEDIDKIMCSLKNLPKLIESKQLQESWLEILYMRLLTHNNVLVIYWSLEFFLTTFSCSKLSRNILQQLLETTNWLMFNNYEDFYLKLDCFSLFLKDDLSNLYELMGEIPWKSISLYLWLNAIHENEPQKLKPLAIDYGQLLKLSSRVYDLKDSVIRLAIIYLMNEIFKQTIEKMSMKQYLTYVEALYNPTDLYEDYETLYGKKANLLEEKDEEGDEKFQCKQESYEIFVKNLKNTTNEVNSFINFLAELPPAQIGWLRFIPYHYYGQLSNENIEILNNLHEMDLNTLKSFGLKEIINEFMKCLLKDFSPHDDDKESIMHCRMAAIAFYVQQKKSFDQIDEETLNIIFDLDMEEYNTMLKFPVLWEKLCECLENTNKILNLWIIDEFLKRICDFEIGEKILKYLHNTYDTETNIEYFEQILEKYPNRVPKCFHQYVNPLVLTNQCRFLNNELEVNDEFKTEQIFCLNKFEYYSEPNLNSYLIQIWRLALQKYCNTEYLMYLINYHKELTLKKPIYDENSPEHRIKLRIAIGICHVRNRNIYNTAIFDEMWNILLNENNQSNICYIYEYILGTYDTRIGIILDKLYEAHTLTSSRQQISIISVTYTYCMSRFFIIKDAIISKMLGLTMCNNRETRQFAQMTLIKLLNCPEFKGIPGREQILQSIENVVGNQLTEYLNNIRLHMHEKEFASRIIQVLLFVTRAPFQPSLYDSGYFTNVEKFFAHHPMSPAIREQLIQCRNNIPTIRKNQISTNTGKDKYPPDLIVCASLMENSMNLKYIAHTCKTLQIKNLVLNTKIPLQLEDEFHKLNITAEQERPLSIIEIKYDDLNEYLYEKQLLENYKIVGIAECSSNTSIDLKNFEFPPKCILLLGHEVHGIPANSADLLDYVLEMPPQFCTIQSKAGLLLWKYSEQQNLMQ